MATYCIVTSSKDIASVSIEKALHQIFKFETIGQDSTYTLLQDKKTLLYSSTQEILYLNNLEQKIEADYFIFASCHESRKQDKVLTVHGIGNWSTAALGGYPRTLSQSSSRLLKYGLKCIDIIYRQELRLHSYAVRQESTHHGPYLEKPSLFIEMGSTVQEWKDPLAAEVIAKAIDRLCQKYDTTQDFSEDSNPIPKIKTAIVLGGPNISLAISNLVLHSEYAFSHICPGYELASLDAEMIQKAVTQSVEKVELALITGLGKEKSRILHILQSCNIPYSKLSDMELKIDLKQSTTKKTPEEKL